MAGIPLIGALTSLGTAGIGAIGTYLGQQALAGGIKYAANLQNQQYNKTLDMLRPSIEAGDTAREYQLGALGLPGGNSDAIDLWHQSPGYQAGLTTGKNAVQTSAAAGGRLFSGGTLKSLDRFGSDYENGQFGDWYNRLGGISGSGQTATNSAINAGTSMTNNLSDLAVQNGQGQASSYGIGAGAINSGLGSLADLYLKYYGGNSSAGTGGGGSSSSGYVWGGLN